MFVQSASKVVVKCTGAMRGARLPNVLTMLPEA